MIIGHKIMLQTGDVSLGKYEPLKKKSLYSLFKDVQAPMCPLSEDEIETGLQSIGNTDTGQFKKNLRKLPYVVCGSFDPKYAKLPYFAAIYCFVIPVECKGAIPAQVRERIEKDERSLMVFSTPDRLGLNVFFLLESPCYDAAQFYYFYLQFSEQWAAEFGMTENVSIRGALVTYKCHYTDDKLCYYNPDAKPIIWKDYLSLGSSRQQIRQIKESLPSQYEEHDYSVDEDALSFIYDRLGIWQRRRWCNEDDDSICLDDYMEGLKESLKAEEIEIKEITDNRYGREILLVKGKKETKLQLYSGDTVVMVVYYAGKSKNEKFSKKCKDMIDYYFMKAFACEGRKVR